MYGNADLKPGTNFFGEIHAGVEEDMLLIKKYLKAYYYLFGKLRLQRRLQSRY